MQNLNHEEGDSQQNKEISDGQGENKDSGAFSSIERSMGVGMTYSVIGGNFGVTMTMKIIF